jgi:DNA polymerase-3 subunit epsilon
MADMSADTPWAELPIALLDVETTGRDPSTDRVVEVGLAISRGGEIVERKAWLINPGRPIPKEAIDVHTITDDDVRDAPRFEVVAAEILEALAGCVPAAYNASFDKAFLKSELDRAALNGAPQYRAFQREVEWIDPLVWARELQSEERSRTLADVAARLNIAMQSVHRAGDDAEAALRVMLALGRDPRVPSTYGPLVQQQRRFSLEQADERRLRWRVGGS